MFNKSATVLLIAIIALASCDRSGENEIGLTGTPSAEVTGRGINSRPQSLLEGLPDAALDWIVRLGMLFNKATVFTISYHEGYNLNFEITEEQARSVLPDNLVPLPLKLLESDSEPRYYVSWYLAVMGGDGSGDAVKRVDLFTYAKDQDDDLALYFLSSITEVPEAIKNNELSLAMYKNVLESFARDSQTGEPAYPHYYADVLTADQDTFEVVYGALSVKLEACEPVTQNERLSREFVMANSQIYRTAIDKNVNYFNQSFIDAKVETREPDCLRSENLEEFDPMLADLKSIHFYGSQDRKITWYFEM